MNEDNTNDIFAAIVGDAGNGAVTMYAVYLHEFYSNLVSAGFTEDQALGMAAQLMTTQQQMVLQAVLHNHFHGHSDG